MEQATVAEHWPASAACLPRSTRYFSFGCRRLRTCCEDPSKCLDSIGQPRWLLFQRAFITSALAAAGGEKVGFLRIAVAALSSLGGLFSQELSLLQLWLPQAKIFVEFPLHSSDSTEQPRRLVFQRAFITSVLAAAGRENVGFPSHSNDGIEQPRRLLGLWF